MNDLITFPIHLL